MGYKYAHCLYRPGWSLRKGDCDNTSRPGFRVDPPFAWETAHEAYFGAVASAQDLLEVTPVSPDNLEETGPDLPYGRPG